MQTVAVKLPDDLYERIRARAEKANRSVEAELVEIVTTALPEADELPKDLADLLASLNFLDDEALWRAARSHFSLKYSKTEWPEAVRLRWSFSWKNSLKR